MTTINADVRQIYVHGAKTLSAKTNQSSIESDIAWIDICADGQTVATVFLPLEVAEAYASAINTCNDREVADAHENIDTNT